MQEWETQRLLRPTGPLPEHQWTTHQYAALGLESCDTCGVVRRRDDRNGPCRGPAQIELREPS